MDKTTTFWHSAPPTDSTSRKPAGSEEKRQDWGYTDHYRRMMQKRHQKKDNLEKTS